VKVETALILTSALVISMLAGLAATRGPMQDCDFDADGFCGCADIDQLIAEIVDGNHDPHFDLNGDGLVDVSDRDAWLALAGAMHTSSGEPFLLGDANLDGTVDMLDLNEWAGRRFTSTPSWCSGDFNADGVVDVSDFNLWNANKFQSS
jgi:hypothetical protein